MDEDEDSGQNLHLELYWMSAWAFIGFQVYGISTKISWAGPNVFFLYIYTKFTYSKNKGKTR